MPENAGTVVIIQSRLKNSRKSRPIKERKYQSSFSISALIRIHRGEAVLRKHLRRRLRTFEENQISKIIRRTKCKMTILKFHQIYSVKKYTKGYASISKTILPQLETAKKPISLNRKHFKKKQRNKEKNFENFSKNFLKVSGKSHSAENLEQSFMLAKRFILSKN